MQKKYAALPKNIRRMIAGVAMKHKIEYSDDKVHEEITIFGEPEKVTEVSEYIKNAYGIIG